MYCSHTCRGIAMQGKKFSIEHRKKLSDAKYDLGIINI